MGSRLGIGSGMPENVPEAVAVKAEDEQSADPDRGTFGSRNRFGQCHCMGQWDGEVPPQQ